MQGTRDTSKLPGKQARNKGYKQGTRDHTYCTLYSIHGTKAKNTGCKQGTRDTSKVQGIQAWNMGSHVRDTEHKQETWDTSKRYTGHKQETRDKSKVQGTQAMLQGTKARNTGHRQGYNQGTGKPSKELGIKSMYRGHKQGMYTGNK